MNSVSGNAKDGNANPTALNNCAGVIESPSKRISNSANDTKESEDKTLLLSRDVAMAINPKRPDLTASVILYGLYTWQANQPKSYFSYKPKINGQPACYRSTRQLEEEYPWWADNTILKAINRAERALKCDFIVQRDKEQLHFHLSDKLIKTYKFDLTCRYWRLDASQ